MELNLWAIIWDSGPVVKGVLVLLLLASIISWGIIGKKLKFYRLITKHNNDFMNLYHGSPDLASLSQQASVLPFSPYKEVFINGYEEFYKIKEMFLPGKIEELAEHFQKYGMGSIERGLHQGVRKSSLTLDQSQTILASIGSITPFVGLFGTVWGIINSFTGLAGGGATLDAVAPGIAEALIATAVGLFAAIPAVWFYNTFSRENQKIYTDMEIFSEKFLNLVERSLITSK